MYFTWQQSALLQSVLLLVILVLARSSDVTDEEQEVEEETVSNYKDSPYFFGEFERDCPDFDDEHVFPDLFFSSSKIPMGMPYRSYQTVPEGWVYLAPSRIPGAGLGAFSATFIPAHTWLGEYEGEIVAEGYQHEMETSYMWQVKKDDEKVYYIDGNHERTSNWLRYGNCPRHVTEENMQVMFCYGKVYYMTSRDILPGTELLIYYGDGYAENLGIDVTVYRDVTALLNF